MMSANLIHSVAEKGTPNNKIKRHPIKSGNKSGIVTANNAPISFPKINLSLGMEFENTNLKVPDSFSPLIILYPNIMAKSDRITKNRNSISKNRKTAYNGS